MPDPAHPAEAAILPEAPPPRPRNLKLVGLLAGVCALVLVGVGVVGRSTAGAKLKHWTDEQSTPTVGLAKVEPAAGGGDLVLPGMVQAYNVAAVHARVQGYLKRWLVDIGARVQAGQLLAEIDAPELNQQLLQAKADLTVAQANERLSQTTADRWGRLLRADAVSKQDSDEKSGDLAAKRSLVVASQANVRRLMETYGFTRLVAPFSGVITARNAQIGQLVTVGGPADQALFDVSDDSRLRVYVRVPQPYIAQLKPGAVARLSVPEYPGRTFPAPLVKTSEAVDDRSGTLLAELQFDNTGHPLKSGEYATARFSLPAPTDTVKVPSSAILFRAQGTMVGVVGPDDRVRLRSVVISRDLGTAVELGGGVALGDRVVDNPADTLTDGQLVRIAAPALASAPKRPRPDHG